MPVVVVVVVVTKPLHFSFNCVKVRVFDMFHCVLCSVTRNTHAHISKHHPMISNKLKMSSMNQS